MTRGSARRKELQETLRALKLIASGRTQLEAAKLLSVNPATLNRRLTKIGYRDFLEVSYVLREDRIAREFGEAAAAELRAWRPDNAVMDLLRDVYGELAPQVHAYHLRPAKDPFSELADRAAPDLDAVLAKCKLVGVAWGRLLAELAKKLPNAAGRSITFIPLCGDAPRSENFASLSSSTLANKLNDIYHTPERKRLSLATVPLMYPYETDDQARDVLDRVLLRQSSAYGRIFGEDAGALPLIEEVDACLTGVGSREHPFGFIDISFLDNDFLDKKVLSRSIHGDIAGNLLPRAEVEGEPVWHKIAHANSCLTCLKLKHLEACARRARRRGVGGVVVIAHGAKKVDAVVEAIRLGLVNHLFVDGALAKAISGRLARGRSS